MLNHVNTVLIGTNCPATYSNEAALAKGDVALFDGNKKLLTSAAEAEAASAVYVGVAADTYSVTDNAGTLTTKREIKFSMPIQKGSKPTMVYADYVAPTEDAIEIAFSGSTIEIGHRFVLRLVYGDIYEAPGQFTHTYEVIATSTSTADLAAAFLAKINKHVSRRVDASIYAGVKATKAIGGITFEAVNAGVAGNSITVQFLAAGTAAISVTGNAIVITPATGALTLAAIQAQIAGSTTAAALVKATAGTASGAAVPATNLAGGIDATLSTLKLTAKVKDDNEGKESINVYSQVSVDAFVWKTIPNGLLSNVMYPVAGLAITKTQGTPGKGNAKIVRDREQAALGYKGITFRTHWPVIKPELNVNLSATYDTMTIENWNSYQSPDNQYVKTTPLATELYVVANELVAGATDSLFKDMVEAFIAKA